MIVTKPNKWTSTPPTGDGYYWWRRERKFKERMFEVHAGIAAWPNGRASATDKMGGEWLVVTPPGPENEIE